MRGVQVLLYVLFTGVLTTNFILRAFNDPDGFKTVIAFALMYMVGFIPLAILLLKGGEPIPWFNDLGREGLRWVALGVLALLVAGWSTSLTLPYPLNAYAAAFVSGLVMFHLLFTTGSILVPILVHGTFNTIVVLQPLFTQYLSWIAGVSMFVPSLGLTVSDLSEKASEVVLQYTFVAPAEEFLKTALASALLLQGSILLLRERWVAAAVAVAVWMSWHAYLAYV